MGSSLSWDESGEFKRLPARFTDRRRVSQVTGTGAQWPNNGQSDTPLFERAIRQGYSTAVSEAPICP